MIGFDEYIILGSTDGKVFVTILEIVDGISLGIDVGTDLVYLNESFDGSNDDKLDGSFLGDSLKSTDGNGIGSYEGIQLGICFGEVLGIIFVNVDGIIFGIDVGTELACLD